VQLSEVFWGECGWFQLANVNEETWRRCCPQSPG
jgi:hypothetical protein